MSSTLRVAGEEILLDDALATIRVYCLDEEPSRWRAPRGGVGAPLREVKQNRFAYRTYDCVPPAPTHCVEAADVLVADGLNAQMFARHIAAILAVADRVSAEIAAIGDPGVPFWELQAEDVATAPKETSSPAWPVWRAWTILRGVAGPARTHKVLHHKRPAVFPLIDGKTRPFLGDNAWATIHADLTTRAAAWAELEASVNQVLRDWVPLTRLRMHDILVWTRATGYREEGHPLHPSAISLT